MPVKVLICNHPGGLHLHNNVVAQLHRDQPSLFDERFSIVALFGPDQNSRDMILNAPHTVVIGDDAFELPMSIEVRSNPWLIAKFEKEGSAGLSAKEGRQIKIVEIPEGIEYYIYRDDDASEEVHETHMVWK
jgi:hypothetical protein